MKKSIEISALVNSGFETTEPEIIVPLGLAENLELVLSAEFSSYSVAGGGRVLAIRVKTPVKVKLILEDREVKEVDAVASVLPGENEVIISDKLAHDLGIVILDPFKGIWCLRDEVGLKERHSVRAEYW